jgi:DnaJ-class molecular chaperone
VVVCPKCDGSALNRKQKPCRRCNGTGKLEGEFINQVHQFIQAQAGDYTKEKFT